VEVAYSIDGVPIRLTTEHWFHIVENHDDLAGHYDDVLSAVENPDLVLTLLYLTRFQSQRFWIDYDQEADVLYISFKRPQNATDSEMSEEGILSWTGCSQCKVKLRVLGLLSTCSFTTWHSWSAKHSRKMPSYF
jgi:hypothetical protein